MVWVIRDPKEHLVPTPFYGQGCQLDRALDQVAQGPIQPGFEHLQGWSVSEVNISLENGNLCVCITILTCYYFYLPMFPKFLLWSVGRY